MTARLTPRCSSGPVTHTPALRHPRPAPRRRTRRSRLEADLETAHITITITVTARAKTAVPGSLRARAAYGGTEPETPPALDLAPQRQTAYAQVNARFTMAPPKL